MTAKVIICEWNAQFQIDLKWFKKVPLAFRILCISSETPFDPRMKVFDEIWISEQPTASTTLSDEFFDRGIVLPAPDAGARLQKLLDETLPRVAFFAPMKPVSDKQPSGDREIARGLYTYLRQCDARVFVLSDFRTRFFYDRRGGLRQWFRAMRESYLQVRRLQPQIYFVYHLYYKAPDPIAFLLATLHRKPYFVFEGMFSRKAARRWGTWTGYFLTRWALKSARLIFSDKTGDLVMLRKWFDREKVIHIPPSVDLTRFQSAPPKLAPRPPIIVTVAMLRADRKTQGVRFLIQSLSELNQAGVDFKWVHIGGGPCDDEVNAEAKQKLGDKAQLLGVLSQAQVTEQLLQGDIFAFPGIDESFGLVYLEAQAAGLPVVAFDNGGVPDAVSNGHTGFLTELMDVNQYTKALRDLIEQPELRLKMGRQAQLFIQKNFSAEVNYARVWSLIKDQVPD